MARLELATRFHEIADFMEATRPLFKSALRAWDEVARFVAYKQKTPKSNFGVSLELLARFELATRFHEIADFMEALRPLFKSALRAWDEVASFVAYKQKTPKSNFGVSLELLARFELATSSLPRMRSTG